MITLKKQYIPTLLALYEQANRAYHTGVNESPLSDAEFDDLRDFLIENLGETHPLLKKVGALIESQDRIPLPRQLGSLNKMRPGGLGWLDNFKNGEVLIATPKLDGLSILLGYDALTGFLKEAFTRGDGVEGRSVLRHILHVPSVPKQLNIKDPTIDCPLIYIRVELFLENSTFEKKFFGEYKNPRNMVAGVLNRKEPTEKELHDFKVLAYSLVDSRESKSKQLKTLRTAGMPTVDYVELMIGFITAAQLTEMLERFRKELGVAIDGVVLELNNNTLRAALGFETNSLNPAYARAFKTSDAEDKQVTRVVDVEWKISKDGFLKPRLVLEPIELTGVTVTHATGFNAKFIEENEISRGAEVLITRSGDVIPYVLEVTKPGEGPFLPDHVAWEWNESEVDIVATEETDGQKVQQLIHFFGTLGVDFFSGGLIERFYNAGFTTVADILALYEKDMVESIEGIQEKMAKKIHTALDEATTDVYLPTLMKASGCFGRNFGETKSELLYNEYKDDLLTISLKEGDILKLRGFSDDTASQAIEGLKKFKTWLTAHRGLISVGKWEDFQAEVTEDKLKGSVFVFTGFRDSGLEEKIVSLGGKIGSGVSKTTNYLVCKSLASGSSKTQKAKDLGVIVLDKEGLLKLLG